MRMYFVVNAFLPNKKAYGIQIAKMCEAFIEKGVDLTLVIPRTRASRASMREFYGLRADVPTVRLLSLGWYNRGRLAFFLSSLCFMKVSVLYLWWKRLTAPGVIYTVDLSTFSFAHLPLSGMPVYMEVHESKPSNIASRYFFANAKGIIATNEETKHQLEKTFALVPARVVVEPNGVDVSWFEGSQGTVSAREKLGLPREKRIALYAGRFYEWKGLDILVEAAHLAADVDWYVVGGTLEEFTAVTGAQTLSANIHVAGECSPREVPLWLAAADVLLVLGTKKNEQSYRHTAPMKVYEYMAARRPIVASRTLALTSIIPANDALWYEPDDAASLAQGVTEALAHTNQEALDRGVVSAHQHTWATRAGRILDNIADIS